MDHQMNVTEFERSMDVGLGLGLNNYSGVGKICNEGNLFGPIGGEYIYFEVK